MRTLLILALLVVPASAQVALQPKWDTDTSEWRAIAAEDNFIRSQIERDNAWKRDNGTERRPWGTAPRIGANGCITQGATMTCPGQRDK